MERRTVSFFLNFSPRVSAIFLHEFAKHTEHLNLDIVIVYPQTSFDVWSVSDSVLLISKTVDTWPFDFNFLFYYFYHLILSVCICSELVVSNVTLTFFLNCNLCNNSSFNAQHTGPLISYMTIVFTYVKYIWLESGNAFQPPSGWPTNSIFK